MTSFPRNLLLPVFGFALAAAAIVAVAALPAEHVQARTTEPDPASLAFYTEHVQPILSANCYRCHGGMNHRGGLQIETRAGMEKGGHDGRVLVPGSPEQSLLIKLIRHEGPANDPMPMPPRSKLSDADIATVTAWVKAGAIMPPDPAK